MRRGAIAINEHFGRHKSGTGPICATKPVIGTSGSSDQNCVLKPTNNPVSRAAVILPIFSACCSEKTAFD